MFLGYMKAVAMIIMCRRLPVVEMNAGEQCRQVIATRTATVITTIQFAQTYVSKDAYLGVDVANYLWNFGALL